MPQISPTRYTVNAGWDSAPHLDERTKAAMLAATPPWMRGARTKGIPSKGAGAIYPLETSTIKVDPFPIPNDWPRGYGMDVGWNWTVAAFFAHDRNTDTLYLYGEHYRGQEKPYVHAEAIKARGAWIPGVIDPAANGRSQDDGEKLIDTYRAHGLKVTAADNDVESGLVAIWQKLAFGNLKVFSSCMYWFSEFEHYRRDEKGKIVKKNDHLMDATRYFINSGIPLMKVKPADQIQADTFGNSATDTSGY